MQASFLYSQGINYHVKKKYSQSFQFACQKAIFSYNFGLNLLFYASTIKTDCKVSFLVVIWPLVAAQHNIHWHANLQNRIMMEKFVATISYMKVHNTIGTSQTKQNQIKQKQQQRKNSFHVVHADKHSHFQSRVLFQTHKPHRIQWCLFNTQSISLAPSLLLVSFYTSQTKFCMQIS